MDREVRDLLTGPSRGFQFEKKGRGSTSVYRCRGAFTLAGHETIEELAAEIKAAAGQNVILDLRDITHIDSAGLGALATCYQELRHAGRSFVVVPSDPVRLALSLVSLDKIFPLAEDVDSAREQLSS